MPTGCAIARSPAVRASVAPAAALGRGAERGFPRWAKAPEPSKTFGSCFTAADGEFHRPSLRAGQGCGDGPRRFYALYPMVRPTLLGQGRSSASEVADTRERPPVIDGSRLPQLAVFAASAVVKASVHIQPVRLGLARDAPPDARQCLPPRFGDRLAALLTGEEAVSPREPAPRPFDSAVYRRVDLILHGAILRPTDRHRRTIRRGRRVSRGRGSSA